MPVIQKQEINKESAIMRKRHSLSHILAEAVQKVYPKAKLGIGPVIENGFYYDFDVDSTFSTKDLKKIEKEMKKILLQKNPFLFKQVSIDEAKNIFYEKDEKYKIDLINELEAEGEKKVGLYYTGEEGWFDLCKGPHTPNTEEINPKGLRLDRVSGAYWKGDENNPMMQRIYGLYFDTREELDEYLKWREEAKKRDHRKLGKELGLYIISEAVGKGLPMLTPKGATLRRMLERWTVDEELKRGYEHVYTPVMGKIEMYQTSGHWEHYKESMYKPIDIDGEMFVLRPMTCPHHFMMYKEEPHSYRDLPIRYAEISSLYRYEKSGELSGLIRLRNFTLADAHNICTEEQVHDEFKNALKLVQYMMDTLGIADKVSYRASLHDEINKEKYIDNPEMWKKSEKLMLEIVDELNLPYYVAEGEAAFYGPKVDVQLMNVMGKEETAFTIQIDYALPEKFDLNYVNSNGDEVRPVVVHRSSIGCIERTMAFLIEHYAGRFPLWLSPIQIEFVSISDNQHDYVKEVMDKFNKHGIRCSMNWRDETISKKLRQARLNLVPYIAIVGDNEMDNGQISIRNRVSGKQETYKVDVVLNRIIQEIETKSLELGL